MNSRNWRKDNQYNIEYFGNRVATYGVDVRSLNWGSKISQHKRFSILAEVGNLDGQSVLDVGCGIGDLLEWFEEEKISVNYSGIDITPKMVDVARQRFPHACFDVVDLLDSETIFENRYDYVFASGIFTYRDYDAFGFLQAMVQKMFSLATVAVAFNTLSVWSEFQEPQEFYADPLQVVSFCRTLTPWVVLKHDYHRGDFSIFLYRESPY